MSETDVVVASSVLVHAPAGPGDQRECSAATAMALWPTRYSRFVELRHDMQNANRFVLRVRAAAGGFGTGRIAF